MKVNDILKEVAVVLSTVIITMAGYWLMIGRELTTRADVSLMITESQEVIKLEINHLSESRADLTRALEKNTDAINDLRIAIAKIVANDERSSE